MVLKEFQGRVLQRKFVDNKGAFRMPDRKQLKTLPNQNGGQDELSKTLTVKSWGIVVDSTDKSLKTL
jgi:hypothetical protein